MEIKINQTFTIDQLHKISEIVAQSDGDLTIIELGNGVLLERKHQAFDAITLIANITPGSIGIDSAIKFLELLKTLT